MSTTVETSAIERFLAAVRDRSRRYAGFAALADQAVVSGTSFATTLAVGRMGGKDDLALYALGFTVLLLAQSALNALVSTPLMVFGPRLETADRRRLAGSSLLHLIVIALVASAALLAAATIVWFWLRQSDMMPLLLVLACTAPCVLLREFARRFEFAHMQFGQALALDTMVAAVQLTALAVLLSGRQHAALYGHAALGASCALAGLVWLVRNRKRFAPQVCQAFADFRRHATFGSWMLLAGVVSLANAYLMHWLLYLNVSAPATGLYAACISLVDFSNPLLLGISNYVGPRAASARAQEGAAGIGRVVARTTLLLCGITVVYGLLLTMFGDQLLTVLFGTEYAADTWLIAAVAWGMCCTALAIPASEGLSVIERPQLTMLAGVAALAISVGLAWWLLPTIGLLGAAVATLAGSATSMALRKTLFWMCVRAEATA